MKRMKAFLVAGLSTLSVPALADEAPAGWQVGPMATEAQCNQAFAQSTAWRTCQVLITTAVGNFCSFRADCAKSDGYTWNVTTGGGTYPQGVWDLVNCNGNLRNGRC